MANSNTKRIVRDGMDNAVVELVGILDTSAATFTVAPAIDLSADFTANLVGPTLVGLRVDEIQYSISEGISIQLFWNATADQPIVTLAGHDTIRFKEAGGLQPNRGAAGYDGDIDLSVNNIVVAAGTPIMGYTLLISMKKLYA